MYRPCSHFFLQFHIVSDVVKITIYCSCFLCSFNRFKLRQNARQVYISCFQNYPCSSTLFKISSECTLYCPCFVKKFSVIPTCLKWPSESTIYCPCFQNVQEAILVLMLPSCFGTKRQALQRPCFKNCPSSSKSFQVISKAWFRDLVFKIVSKLPNIFKQCHNSFFFFL